MAPQRRKPAGGRGNTAGDKIFQVACELFYRHGIRAVGVESIVKDAGVAKISLYRSFASKDDLIVAYLENRNAEYWRIIEDVVDKHSGDPHRQIKALAAYIADRVSAEGYRGCPFINYASEFPDKSHPGHRVVAKNKLEMRRRLADLASELDCRRPRELAEALFLLIEGAYASSQTAAGRNGPAKILPHAAESIVGSYLR